MITRQLVIIVIEQNTELNSLISLYNLLKKLNLNEYFTSYITKLVSYITKLAS
jgi:hypothetical protein